MGETKTLSKKAVRVLSNILEGCHRCEFDEAEGDIVDHCADCCRRGMAWAYQHWMSLALTQALLGNPRTAMQQRGRVSRRIKRMSRAARKP